MTAADYGENWIEFNDPAFIARVKHAFTITDPENRFDPYDYYMVADTFSEGKVHYVVRVYAGRNGCGDWVSYLTDMSKAFHALTNHSESHFSKAWLIEWKNGCANDTSAALIGLRD